MNEIINKAIQEWGDLGFNVIDIGNDNGKDFDLVIIGNGESVSDALENLKHFSKIARKYLNGSTFPSVVLKLDHYGHVSSDERPLHLLFYPTITHLRFWELPSFITYVYQYGSPFFGSLESLESDSNEYIQGNMLNSSFDSRRFHLRKYGSIACSVSLYTCGIKAVVPRRFISILFRYATRYIILEILREDNIDPPFTIPQQLKLLEKKYPEQENLSKVLKMDFSSIDKIPEKRLSKWSFQLFQLSEIGQGFLKDNLIFNNKSDI